MARRTPDMDLVKLVARLYYIDSLSQSEIARMVSASQAKVCRLLSYARKSGVVQISVDEYDVQNVDLEQELRDVFGLKKAIVVQNLNAAREKGADTRFGYFAAPALARVLSPGQLVGLTGSRTFEEIFRYLGSFCHPKGLRVVPLMGSIDAGVASFDAVELGRKLADMFDSMFYNLNSPVYLPDEKSCQQFLELDQVQSVWKLFKDMDIALMGIGTLNNSVFIDRNVLTESDLQELRKMGVVGEIYGRFYDKNGQECNSEWKNRSVSISFEMLKKIPLVVGATRGVDRAEAVLGAVRGGLINALFIDEAGARAVLKLAKNES